MYACVKSLKLKYYTNILTSTILDLGLMLHPIFIVIF